MGVFLSQCVVLWKRIYNTAVFWSLATTGLRLLGVVAVLPVVLRTVPEKELGLFYLFQTFGMVGMLLDAGMAPTLSRSVSFAWTGAKSLKEHGHELVRDDANGGPNWRLMGDILGTARIFYRAGAVLLLIVLGIGCSPLIWELTKELDNPWNARSVWIAGAIGTALSFSASVWPSFLNGVNRVRDQSQIQLVAIAVGYLATVGGLLLGGGLWALVGSLIVQAAVIRTCARWICLNVTKGRICLARLQPEKTIFRTMWPSAWRTGLISVLVACYINGPVLLTSLFAGLAESARTGLAMQLSLTICQIASAPFMVKLPIFSMLASTGRAQCMRQLFIQRSLFFLLIYILGAVAVIFLGEWLLHTVIMSKTRLPGLVPLILVFAYVGLEGFQALFRSLCLSSNVTTLWRSLAVGVVVSFAAAWTMNESGLAGILIALVISKFVLTDLPIYRAGMIKLTAKAVSV